MSDNSYYVRSAYKEMFNGMAYLYLDENHQWTLDPTRVKFFDSYKRAQEIAELFIKQRVCEVRSTLTDNV